MSDTLTAGDTEILQFLEFEHNDPTKCEFGDCPKDATDMIVCKCTEGMESICGEHAKVFEDAPEYSLFFDHTCGHSVYAGECTILPL